MKHAKTNENREGVFLGEIKTASARNNSSLIRLKCRIVLSLLIRIQSAEENKRAENGPTDMRGA